MFLIFFTYTCFIIFLIGVAGRIYRQKKLPLHLRWELYPVKNEPGAKAQYGGSYMEEPNWWEKERTSSLGNEIKYMIPEILFLRGLWEKNRQLWCLSFPFHFGLYLILATLLLLLLSALAMIRGIRISPNYGGLSLLLYYLTIFSGFLGLTLGAIGAVGLLIRRWRDPELRAYSNIADYFNLLILLGFLVVAFLSGLFYDPTFDRARAYVHALLTLRTMPLSSAHDESSFLGSLTIFWGSIILAYIPFTHMAHMFMKFFSYHEIRWEHTPNLKGGKIEAAVQTNLKFKPTWSAPHIKADGQKTWNDLAGLLPKEKNGKDNLSG
ncbi:MAG: respiratory nitrate reductase subunit gamma [Thermodesulfobacteriota bacterium]